MNISLSGHRSHRGTPIMRLCTAIVSLAFCVAVDAAEDDTPTWTNQAGKTVTANFIRLDSDTLVLRKDGRVFNIPLNALSSESQRQATELAELARQNPVAAYGGSDKPSQMGLSPERLSQAWTDLLEMPPTSTRALLRLSRDPQATTRFLSEQLKPLKTSREEVAELLTQLGSDDEAVRQGAEQRLRYFDPRLVFDLEELSALEVSQEPKIRNRLAGLLIKIGMPPQFSVSDYKFVNFYKLDPKYRGATGDYSVCFSNDPDSCEMYFYIHSDVSRVNTLYEMPEWTRAVYALKLLQSFETPEANQIIAKMATGHPDAQPTRIAKFMLFSCEPPGE